MKKNLSFAKLGVIYTISNLIVKGIAFLTTPIFTRLMSQNDFGQFSGISAWANIISVIVTLSLYSSISRAKYDFEEDIDKYLSSILIFGNVFTIFSWIIVELKIGYFEKIFSMDRTFIRSILLYCIFQPSIQMLLLKNRMINNYKKVIGLTWITLLTSVFSSLLLVYFLEDKLAGRVYGTYIAVSIINLIFWLEIIYKGKSFDYKYVKYACFLSLPLVFHELSGILLNSSDRIMVNDMLGGKAAALYSLAYTVATIVTVLLSSINQAWVPWFYDNLNEKKYNLIKNVSRKYTAVIALGCILLMLIGPEMIMIFGGKKYMDAVYVIPPVSLSIFLQYLYTQYVNIEFFLKKTFYISLATIAATTINIGLNFILIPKFGYVAAAYTTVIGYFFMLLFHYFMCSITEYSNIFSKKLFAIYFIIVLFSMFVSIELYNFRIIRYFILFCIMIFTVSYIYKHYFKKKKSLNES